MDKLSVEVEFPIDNPRLKRESEESKNLISGIGETAEKTAERVNKRMGATFSDSAAEVEKYKQSLRGLDSLKPPTDPLGINDLKNRIGDVQNAREQLKNLYKTGKASAEEYERSLIALIRTERELQAEIASRVSGSTSNAKQQGSAPMSEQQRLLRAVSDEYRGLLAESTEAYNAMLPAQQRLVMQLINAKQQLESVKLAQKQLNEAFAAGTIKSKEYDKALAALVVKEREVNAEITRMSNIGRKGFDEMGNAIKKNANLLGTLWSWFRQIAYLIPGLGIAGAFSLALAPLTEWVKKLLEGDKAVRALNKTMQEAASLTAKEIAETQLTITRINDKNLSLEGRQKLLNDFINANPNVLGALNLQNVATSEGKAILDQYIESLRKKIELQQLEKAYTDSMQREADLRSGKLSEETDFKWYNSLARYAGRLLTFTKTFQETTKEIDEINKQRRNEAGKEEALIRKSIEEQIKAKLEGTDKLVDADNTSLAALEQSLTSVNERLRNLQDGESAKTLQSQKKSLEKQIAERKKLLGLESKEAVAAAQRIINNHQSLLDKIASIEAEYTRKGLDKDAEELQALRDKFSKIKAEVQRFNADPKNKNVRIELKGLDDAQARAEEDLVYRQDTEKLKKQLEEQKKVYDEYERYKSQFGKKAADERFKEEKNGFDTYTDFLNAKAKENAGAIAAAMTGTATGGQSERVKLLIKQGADEKKAQEDSWNEQLAGLLSYEKGRAKLIEDYNVLRKKLIEQGKTEEAYVLDEQFKNELNQYDDTNIQKLDSYKELFEGIERLTDVGARRVIANAQSMLKALLAAGKISPELAKEIGDKLADTQQALDDRLPNRLNDLAQGLSQIVDLVSTIDSGLGGVLGTVTSIVGASAQVFGNLKGLKDGLLNFRQNSTDGGGGILGTISAIAGVAGPASAIVGAVSGVAKGVVGFFKARKEAAEAARKAVQDYYSSIAAGEREYDKLLRQRELTAVQQGKTSYKAIIDQLELLKKQAPEIEEAYNKIYAALQGQEYVSGIGYKHGTWFRKAKTWDVMSSLAGADYDRLEQLYTQGALKDQARADFEALRSLREELESAGLDVADLQRQLNEMLTGTSATGLSDSLTQLFQNGKLAAADLGQSFEEIMRNAISNTFKYKYLEEQMSPFYDALSDLMQSGTPTEAQINQLRDQYTKIGQEAAKQWENLEKVTGIKLENTNSGGMSGAIQQITQNQADVLAGQVGGIHIAVVKANEIRTQQTTSLQEQTQMLRNGIMIQKSIEQNTRRTADNTDRLQNVERYLYNIDKKMNSDSALRAAGAK